MSPLGTGAAAARCRTGKRAGPHVEMFRLRFLWSLLPTVPVILTSHMLMDWLGSDLGFYGIELVGPALGSVIFLWGGWPFLEGGRREIQERPARNDAVDRDGDQQQYGA